MTVKRNLSHAGIASSEWVGHVDDAINYLLGLNAAKLTGVGGSADAITASLLEGSGFSNGTLKPGAGASLVAASAAIGPTTLNIDSGGAIAVKDKAGAAIAPDAWAAGDLLALLYDGTSWRLVGVTSGTTAASSGTGVPPYLHVTEIAADATWTAPYKCYVRIWAKAAGASGGASGNRASGAGGGEGAVKDRFLMEAGQQLACTIGTGGAPATGVSAGNDGGATTVTGPGGFSLTVNGGKGGNASNSSVYLNGGAGGTGGTGGDVHVPGQAGADCNTNDTGTAGGYGGLLKTPTALPAGHTSAGKHPITDEYSLIKAVGPFTDSSPLAGGHGHTAAGSPGAGQIGAGGGGGGDITTTNSGAGGDGMVVIEQTPEIA